MFKKKTLLSLTVLSLFASSFAGSVSAADKTSKFRVYQNTTMLLETSDYKTAENYAQWFADSHVEEIGSRSWLWHNYPRYKVYQQGYSSPQWEFQGLDQAIREASNWASASVRDLQSGGWVWNNYPRYRVYQGDITLDSWTFPDINAAIGEASKWAGSHIIDLNNHAWVWDNIPYELKQSERSSGLKKYQVAQGTYTSELWKFALLEDAVNESLKWGNSTITNLSTGQVVFTNKKPYQVYQNEHFLTSFIGIDDAIAYARQYAHSRIVNDEAYPVNGKKQAVWNNYPYYRVYQNENWIGEFNNIAGALSYAQGYASSSIRLYDDGMAIWDNLRKLMFWGWNGSSSDVTIRKQVGTTSGLDVVSPTYFSLADSSGTLSDTSNKGTVDYLKKQGYSVHPLVNNQFDSAMTTAFLASPPARTAFINALVDKGAALGVNGLNIDFESVAGGDRANFTAFMQELTDTAHQKGLTISVDLPRGSAKWNAKTAFDHEKLAGIVDYIITMTYDQYWKGSEAPGSVAGLPWVEEGVKEFLSYGIPRDKLIMGIPFYVREWQVDSAGNLVNNRALFLKDLPALIQEKNAAITWDAQFGQNKVQYSENGYNYVFWLENEDTIKARIDIAKKYDLAGVAAWRLGYDDANLWSTMIQHK